MRRTSDERSRQWYQTNARHYDRHNPGLPGDREFYASLCPGARVLEIGAGTGRVTGAIAGVASSVIAIDNAPAMLTIARRRLGHIPTVALILAEAGDLPFSAGFDRIIVAYRTLQHFAPAVRHRLWERARTLLCPSGIVAFDTWHGPRASGHTYHHVPMNQITVAELQAELMAFGLQVLRTQTSFVSREVQQSLTRVWVIALQDEEEKSGEKFHEVLDTRGRRL